jgi:multidrug resistance efflux pump
LKPESEEEDKSSLKIRRKIENRKKILEARIGEIESNITQKETEMEKHPADYEKQRTLYEEKCILQQNLDRVFAEWMTLEEDRSGIM